MDTEETTSDGGESNGATSGGISVEDIEAELGLEPETPEEKAGGEKPAAVEAKGTEKDDEAETDEGGEKKPAAAAKTEAEKEIEEWMAVRKRAKERKAAALAASRATPAASATAAAAPAKTDGETPAATAAAAKPASEVQAAVADIIKALERLDGDGEEGETPAAGNLAAKAAREVDLTAIKEKLGVLATAVEESAAAKAKFGDVEKELRGKLKEIEDTRFVETLAEQTIAKHEDKLPLLSQRRDGARLVFTAASKFLERKGKAPPLAFVAESVERVLARRAGASGEDPPRNGAVAKRGGPEKQHTSRTTSSSLATPPSRRQGADTRTPEQVDADFWAAFPGAKDG